MCSSDLFNKYGLTQADFDTSLVWYTRNTEVLAKVYEKVTSRLKSKQTDINKLIAIRDKKPMTSNPGDSINVWAWSELVQLTPTPLDNTFTFVLPSDTNFKARDLIVWDANFILPETDSVNAPVMSMQIVYNNDSVISITKRIYENGFEQIQLQSDTLGEIKEMKGFVYYPIQRYDEPLLIDNISLMRYHSKDTLVVINDSILLNVDANKVDSIIKSVPEEVGTKVNEELHRVNPDEMNKKRANPQRVIKQEQIEVEKHINEEKLEIQKNRPQRAQPARRLN